MSAPDDERRRLAKKYTDVAAQELLALFDKRETLPAGDVDALRLELRLRGLDPDSLRATVPKATPMDDEGSSGDASLVDADLPPDEPSKSVRARREPDAEGNEVDGEAEPEPASPAEEVAAAAAIRCLQCGARNPAVEDLCLRCGQPLAESPQHQTMARRIAESSTSSSRPSGTIASATTGVAGISALVFASYSLTLESRLIALTLVAAVVGAASLIAAVWLYRVEKKRRDAEASVN